jgi:uncharacterized RDD family membrane protein YckC
MRSNGEDSGFWCGFGRRFIMIPSGLILGIGLLMTGFAGRKQALKDLGRGTVVAGKWALTEHPSCGARNRARSRL